MNALLEVLSFVVVVSFILALFFVFDGEPDLWDAWRAKAMEASK